MPIAKTWTRLGVWIYPQNDYTCRETVRLSVVWQKGRLETTKRSQKPAAELDDGTDYADRRLRLRRQLTTPLQQSDSACIRWRHLVGVFDQKTTTRFRAHPYLSADRCLQTRRKFFAAATIAASNPALRINGAIGCLACAGLI